MTKKALALALLAVSTIMASCTKVEDLPAAEIEDLPVVINVVIDDDVEEAVAELAGSDSLDTCVQLLEELGRDLKILGTLPSEVATVTIHHKGAARTLELKFNGGVCKITRDSGLQGDDQGIMKDLTPVPVDNLDP